MNDYLKNLGMKIVPSTPDHIPDELIDNDLFWERITEEKHEANTLLKNGDPVGMAGYQKLNDSTAEVWSLLIDDTYGKTFFKCVKHYVDNVYSLRFDRLQAVVDVDDEVSQRFDEALGFEKETVLKEFCDGDYILYRRLS